MLAFCAPGQRHCLPPCLCVPTCLCVPPWRLYAEMVMAVFGAAGEVSMVRIRKPDQPEPLLTKGLRSEVAFSNKVGGGRCGGRFLLLTKGLSTKRGPSVARWVQGIVVGEPPAARFFCSACSGFGVLTCFL